MPPKTPPYIQTEINGTKIVIYPLSGVRTVMLYLIIRGGSWYEPNDKYGGLHLLEHLTFQGTELFPEHDSLEEFKENYGIANNAWTGGQDMGYWVKVPSQYLQEGIRLLDQLVFHPLLPESQIKREVNVIRQEYYDFYDSPFTRFKQIQFQQLIGQDHPYTHDALGKPDFIEKLTRTDLQNLHQQFYQPQNMTLSIAGNIDPDQTIESLRPILTRPANNKPLPKLNHSSINSGESKITHYDTVDQAHISVQWLLPGKNQLSISDRLAINLTNYLLGGSTRSVLYNRLRQQLGLAYHTDSDVWFGPTLGNLNIRLSTQPDNVDKTLSALQSIISDFVSKPVSTTLFSQAKRYLDLQTLSIYDSVTDIAGTLGRVLFNENRVLTPDDYISLVKPITQKQSMDLLIPHLNWNQAFISFMLPLKKPTVS